MTAMRRAVVMEAALMTEVHVLDVVALAIGLRIVMREPLLMASGWDTAADDNVNLIMRSF
jgi:hypothetical protein